MWYGLIRRNRSLAAMCFLGAMLAYPVGGHAVEETHRCDELAAHAADPNRWAQGVADEGIVPAPAIKSCTEAVNDYPGEPRFKFQLGRALLAAGRYDEAVSYFNEAGVESGYAPALAYMGIATLNGWGGLQKNEEKARELLQASAQAGFPAAGNMLAAMDEPRLPFDGNADPRRKARYLKSFDANAFSFPYFAQAVFDGDFDAIPRPLGFMYLRNFHNMFAPNQRNLLHYDDPQCTLAYDPGVESSAKLEAAAEALKIMSVMAGLASDPENLNAAGKAAEGFVRWFYDSPETSMWSIVIGLVVLETKLDELWGKVRRDHEQFVVNNGCESPASQRFLGNMRAFILGTAPVQSPAVAERVSIRKSSENLRQACVRQFTDDRFCTCAIGQLLSSGIDAQAWQRIESDMDDMTRLPPDLDLRSKLRICYG